MQARLSPNSQIYACLWPLSARIKGPWPLTLSLKKKWQDTHLYRKIKFKCTIPIHQSLPRAPSLKMPHLATRKTRAGFSPGVATHAESMKYAAYSEITLWVQLPIWWSAHWEKQTPGQPPLPHITQLWPQLGLWAGVSCYLWTKVPEIPRPEIALTQLQKRDLLLGAELIISHVYFIQP